MRIFLTLIGVFSTFLPFAQDDSFAKQTNIASGIQKVGTPVQVKLSNTTKQQAELANVLNLVRKLGAAGEYNKVIKLLENTTSSTLGSYELYFYRGVAYNGLDEYELAIAQYEQALKYYLPIKSKVYVLNNLASSQIKVRQFGKAYRNLEKAHALAPQNVSVLVNLGAVCAELGQNEQALLYLEQAVALNPSVYQAIGNIGYHYIEIGEFEKALPYFDKVLELMPNEPISLNNIAYCKFRLGDIDKALILVNKSIELAPSNAYAYKNRALIFRQLNRVMEACQDLSTASRLGFKRQFGSEVLELEKRICTQP